MAADAAALDSSIETTPSSSALEVSSGFTGGLNF
jgi:hypothetical protein